MPGISSTARTVVAKFNIKLMVFSAGDPYEKLLRALRIRFSEIIKEEVEVSSIGFHLSLHCIKYKRKLK